MPSKTSIVLSTYNEANYIENTISELEKNIPDLEIVIVDDSSSDGTIEIIKKLPEMINLLKSENDLVLLSRFVEGGGDNRVFIRAFCSKYFNIFCRVMFRTPIKDLTSSVFLMKRKILDEVTFLGYGHGEFFLEFLYNVYQKGFKVKEIPYIQKKDEDISNSKSAPNLIKFFYLGFLYILRVFATLIRRKN